MTLESGVFLYSLLTEFDGREKKAKYKSNSGLPNLLRWEKSH